MESEKDERQEELDWENRTLCGDESCIGTIGPDGRCKECGKAYDGKPTEENPAVDAGGEYIEDNAAETDLPDDTEPGSTSDDDWDRRTLCSDESCIGVIGPDGRCNECGKPFESG